MKVLVSVIIPAYNSSKYITQTIESVLSQTYRNIEVIIVDDASTDDTVQKALKFEEHGVKVLYNPKKGACAARNFGFLNSKGDFIQFLDADDFIAPDKIEKQMAILSSCSNPHELMIHCKWGRFRDNEDVYYWGPHEQITKDLDPIEWLVSDKMSITNCWLTHRRLIEKAGLWDESLRRNQDGEFFTRIMINATKVLFCEGAKVYYRSGNIGSISGTVSRPAMESLLRSYRLIEKYVLSLEVSSRVKLSIANRYQDFAYANYIANPDLAALAESKVKELGGAELKLPGGNLLRFLATLIGWKNALKIKKLLNNASLA